MKRNKIILIGGGGHCKSCIDVIEQEGTYEIAGIIDIKERIGNNILGYPIIGCDTDLEEISKKYDYFLITIGQIKTPALRIKLFNKLKDLGKTLPVVISPRSHVSKYAEIGEGSIIMHNAVVNSSSKIGANCIINSMALIEHDSCVGNNCHISTGAIINGYCTINAGNFIGSRSVVNNNINIAENCILATGTVVIKDIEINNSVWVGNPAKMK